MQAKIDIKTVQLKTSTRCMGRGRKQKTALIHINLLNVNIPIL